MNLHHGDSGMSAEKLAYSAKVCLSFEPQLASNAESLNELFHVLFNTVMHQYTHMHDHGLLGDKAMSILTEAVSAGMDCANHEVNAMRVADFHTVGKSDMRLAESAQAARK